MVYHFLLKMFIRLIKLGFWLGLVSIIAMPLVLLVLGIESQRQVPKQSDFSYDEFAQINQLVRENDPRRNRPNVIETTKLTNEQVNLLLQFGLTQISNASGKVTLSPGGSLFELSSPIGVLGPDAFINLKVAAVVKEQHIQITSLRLGKLHLPGAISGPMANFIHALLTRYEPYQVAVSSIKNIQVHPDELIVKYQWSANAKNQIRTVASSLLGFEDGFERMYFYHQIIADLSLAQPYNSSLHAILQPLFAKALKQSQGDPQIAADDNQAIILALGFYVMGFDPSRFPGAESMDRYTPPRRTAISLNRRRDLGQHYIASAAVATSAGARLADSVGLFKEIQDSQGGSGFSFADLAADTAGVRFAQLASNEENAIAVQEVISRAKDESAYMPEVDRLPENIQELEFKRRFEDLDSKQYNSVIGEINRRLAACQLYL